MITCTIITIWNDLELLHMLKQDLAKQQDVSFSFLDIDNRSNLFKEIRQAFNAYIDQVQTKYVLFLHQDIRFLNNYVLRDILKELEQLGDFGVVGVAGCPTGAQWHLFSNIVHGNDKTPAGIQIDSPLQVQTVDECLFAMQAQTLKELRFTEMEGWHLYAVEQCLRAEALGLKNYVIPAQIYHLSNGASLDPSYIPILLKLGQCYPTKLLNTTVKQWDFGTKKGLLYIKYYYVKQKCKKKLKDLGLLKG